MTAIASEIVLAGSSSSTFESRCRAMQLFVWQFDGEGILRTPPSLSAALNALLASSDFNDLLSATARRLLASPAAGPEEISPGVWAIPTLLRRRARTTDVLLTVGIERAFCESALLRQICAANGLSLADAGETLSPVCREVRGSAADLHRMLTWMHADLHTTAANRTTMNEFSTNLAQSYEQVNFVFRLARYLNVVQDPTELIELLLAQVREILPFSWVAVRFLPQRTHIPELGADLILYGTTDHRAAIDAAALGMINQWTRDEWTKILTGPDHAVAVACGAEVLADPILHDQKVIGVLMVGNKTGDDPDIASTDVQLLDAIANFLGVFHENIARFSEQRSLFMGSLHALTSAIDAKDHYTRGHSDRVGLLAAQMARAMGMAEQLIEQYRIAGLVHDVGKIGVRESVLTKASALTDEEFAEIKRHPRIGYEILKDIVPLQPILPGVLHHHERWDGRGYPDGVAGKDLATIARVLALADTFDAMSSQRAYRTSRPRETVFAEIRRHAGTQFDPELVEIFLALDFTEFDSHLARIR